MMRFLPQFAALVIALSACTDPTLPVVLEFLETPGLNLTTGTVDTCVSDADCQGALPGACSQSSCVDGRCQELMIADGSSCDDGDACTEEDACQDGVCVGGESICACEADSDCNGALMSPCDGVWRCIDGGCEVTPDTAVDCSELTEGPCSVGACDPDTGDCSVLALEDGASCDDGNACSEGTTCEAGSCSSGTVVDCDDDNVCTEDVCLEDEGCVSSNVDGECDDGDACTLNESCLEGVCTAGAALPCASDNPCEVASCDAELGCQIDPAPAGSVCDDGNPCTEGDACDLGVCVSGTSICQCENDSDCPDDGDLCNGVTYCQDNECVVDPLTVVSCLASTDCTVYACEPTSGECEVSLIPNGQGCDDAGACMEPGICSDGWCEAAPVICDDDNPCTLEKCDMDVDGCVYVEVSGAACEDGDACTEGDTCTEGICTSGASVLCNDDDSCTEDSCDVLLGCQFVPVSCDDGLTCTDDACTPDLGCEYQPVVCPEGDACQEATCDEEQGGCIFVAETGTECEDGDPCTTDDLCETGECVGVYACDDDNSCTEDSCTAAGCVNAPLALGTACNDNNLCTTEDQCLDDVCQGIEVDCLDDDPCTTESCEAGQCEVVELPGCAPDEACEDALPGESCDDGDPATVADMCLKGKCRGFSLQRTLGSEAIGDVTFTRTARTGNHWFVAMSQLAEPETAYHAIGYHDAPELPPFVLEGSAGDSPFTAIHSRYAIRQSGELFRFMGIDWTGASPASVALEQSGLGEAYGLWVYRYQNDVQIFVTGELDEDTYFRRCVGESSVDCLQEPIAYANVDTLGRGLTGTAYCNDAGACTPAAVMTGDEVNAQGNSRNHIHVHYAPNGMEWQLWYYDDLAGEYTSRDIGAYGDGRYLAVGGAGYVRFYKGNGGWSYTSSNLVPNQQSYTISGIWIGDDVVMVVAYQSAGNDDEEKYDVSIWTCPSDADPRNGNNWTVHPVGSVLGFGAGAFDISGTDDGQIRAVGAGLGDDFWLDGVVWSRVP